MKEVLTKRNIIVLAMLGVLLVGLIVGLNLVSQRQNLAPKAGGGGTGVSVVNTAGQPLPAPSDVPEIPQNQPTVAVRVKYIPGASPQCRIIDCAAPPQGCGYEGSVISSCDPNVQLTCGRLVCENDVSIRRPQRSDQTE